MCCKKQWMPLLVGLLLCLCALSSAEQLQTPHASPESTVQRVIDPALPMVALTFDDGPSEYTEQILDLLKQYGANATFCVIGNRCDRFADTIRRAHLEGNEIATHTWNHRALSDLSTAAIEQNLTRALDKIEKICGERPAMLRPPYGKTSAALLRLCKNMNINVVTWSVDSRDWKTRNAKKTSQAILSRVKNGSIILCHDLYEQTAVAMETVLPALVEKGYQIVSVSQLFSFYSGDVKPGKVYTHVDPEHIAAPKKE